MEGGGENKRDDRRQKKRNGDKIGRNGSGGEGRGDAHLLILHAPQAENCSRVVFGLESDFWARREAEEEEPSEGEPELCLIGIIVKKRETEKAEERERKMREGGGTFELKRPPLCIRTHAMTKMRKNIYSTSGPSKKK